MISINRLQKKGPSFCQYISLPWTGSFCDMIFDIIVVACVSASVLLLVCFQSVFLCHLPLLDSSWPSSITYHRRIFLFFLLELVLALREHARAGSSFFNLQRKSNKICLDFGNFGHLSVHIIRKRSFNVHPFFEFSNPIFLKFSFVSTR